MTVLAEHITEDVLFESAACGLILTRDNGEVVRANETFCTWLGYDETALLGRRFQDLLTVGGKMFHQTHWLPLMRMQGSAREVKLEMLTHHGSRVVVLLNGVRRETEGEYFHHLALFELADRDRYEREILQARKLAEDALQAKTEVEAALRDAQSELQAAYEQAQDRAEFAEQMVAIASHDLKTPLSAILMAGDLLRRSPGQARRHALAQLITQAAGRADRLIRDFLDFTLIRVGKGIRLTVESNDLHQVVAGSLDELRVAFPGARFEHVTHGNATSLFDSDRIRQLVGNLVANSVAYGAPEGLITVRTAVTNTDLRLSVHNWGAPIPEALHGSLFEAMSRGVKGGDARSVGLGLFIVREIVRAHEGDIQMASTLDAGTTFLARWPAKRDA